MSSTNQEPICPDIAKQETKKKQLYLKDNIMENGYDPDDFATFLENEKEGGIDIENWTFEELETLVHLFRKTRDLFNQQEQPEYDDPDDLLLDSRPTRKTTNSEAITDLDSVVLSRPHLTTLNFQNSVLRKSRFRTMRTRSTSNDSPVEPPRPP
jgi:hypothetical protein